MALSTKVSILDKGEKDIFNVEYSNGRVLRSNERDLEDYDVEEGTEVICDRAFANRDKLVNIYLPDSVKAIGESAFSGCRNLKEINIPEGVEEIKANTFNGCNSLEEIVLPTTIKNIDKFAFERGLKSLTILSPDAQIHRHAFLNCRNLESIKVPEGSTSFYQPQFKEANIKTNIEEIKLNDEEINIESEVINNNTSTKVGERTVTIVVTGRELEAILSEDGDESSDFSIGDSIGMLVYDDYAEFTVYDGDEEEVYTIDDFEMDWEELEDPENPFPSNLKEVINIEKWVKENGGAGFKLYENKSQTQFEIQLKAGEKFDPSKAAVIPLNYIFRDVLDEPMMYKFVYNGKTYDFGPIESDGGSCIASYSLKDEEDSNNTKKKDLIGRLTPKTGGYGFLDLKGNWVISPIYEDTGDFSEGFAKVKIEGKWGFIDKTGKIVIGPIWDYAYNFYEGLAIVKIEGKWGFIDKTGKTVIEPKWNDAGAFFEGLARVELDGKRGFIDKTGKTVIEPIWDEANSIFEGLAKVKIDGKYGFIDKTGKTVIEPKWDFAYGFSDGLARIGIDGKWGVIDKTGKTVTEPKWDFVDRFSEGLGRVKIDGKWGFIDKTGKTVIEPKCDIMFKFSDGLARIGSDGKCGFIGKTGKIVIEPKWDDAKNFSEGLAAVNIDGKWGFIDTKGKIIIEPQFEFVWGCENGYLLAGNEDLHGLMDKNGNWVFEPGINVSLPSEGLVSAEVSQYGLVDEEGNWVVMPKYDSISVFYPIGKNGKELALALIGEKQIWLDTNGNECPYAIIDYEDINDNERKTVPAEAYGREWFVDIIDEEGDPIDGNSAFVLDDLCIVIDEEEFDAEDFNTIEIEGFDATVFCEESKAAKGILYFNKASCYESFNEIYLPERGDFDLDKAVILTSYWETIKKDDTMGIALIYDGVKYKLSPEDSVGNGSTVIYGDDDEDSDDEDQYDDDEDWSEEDSEENEDNEASNKKWLEDKYYNSEEKNKITLYLYTEGVRIDIRGDEGELIDCEMAIREDSIQGVDVYINGEEAGTIDQEDLGKPLTMDDDDDPNFDENYDWGGYWDLYKPKEVFKDAKQHVWDQSKVGAEIIIELEAGEKFDPKKLRLLVSEMPVPDAEFEVYCSALYNGKIYPIEIDIDSEDVKNEEIIWEDED